nr:gliding motility-associated C-terminal domain-containing protein [Bacteroidota bacterium]
MKKIKQQLIKSVCCFFGLILIHVSAIAQPINDECYLATPIVVPQSGQVCINASNANATPDAITPNTCNQPTGGNEVWFTYITTGTNNLIAVSPSGGTPAQTLALTIPTGGCAGNIPLACNASATLNGTAIINQSFPVGTQVWFEVTALTSDGDFTICITSADNPPAYAPNVGDSCTNAIQLCNKQSFTTLGAPGFANSGAFLTCYGFGALNDIYYKFDVGKTGTLEWLATPSGAINLDWEVLDITGGCPGVSIACNYTYVPPGGQSTGIQDTSTTPCGNIGHICQSAIVTAGNTYVIHLNNTSFLPGVGFTISFGGTFEMAPFPSYSLTNSIGCGTLTTSIVDSSVGSTNYNWVFGNGNTFAGANPPAQTYIAPGTYMTSLVVSNASSGCSHVTSVPVVVKEKPTADFILTDTTICIGQSTSAVYVGTATPGATYTWNFSGANVTSGTGQGPYTLDWPTVGSKTITLYVTENGCTSDTITKTVVVSAPPVASFSLPATACTGDTLLVTYTGTVIPGATFFWNFGNGFSAGGNGNDTVLITWPTAQTDSISLTVSAGGCLSTILYHTIVISDKPTSTFTLPDSTCTNNTITLNYTGTGTVAAVYNWNFAGGNALPGGTVQGPHNITWVSSGLKQITLSVTENGCTSSITKDTVYVMPGPDASFSLSDDTLCTGETVTVTYTGTTPGAIFNWNFSGANILSGSGAGPYVLDWPTTGVHVVSLLMSFNSCNDSIADTIYSGLTPFAFVGIDKTYCSGDSVTIGAPAVPGITYNWSPAIGLSSATVSQPTVNLTNTGAAAIVQNYILTTSNLLCTANDTVQITVTANQPANISLVGNNFTQCIANNDFDFSLAGPLVPGASINWTFGAAASPLTSTNAIVNNVIYNAVGTYIVQLITSANGCPADTDTVTVTIQDAPKVKFGADTLIGCPPLSVSFTDSSTAPPGSTYVWDFGNSDTSTLANPNYTYAASGLYNVTLTVTSPNGCSASSVVNNYINVTQEPTAVLEADPNITTILQPNIQFLNVSPYADSCYIDFGDGTFFNGCGNIEHVYGDTGTYIVTLYTMSAGGCVDSTEITVIIKPFFTLFIPNSFTPNKDDLNELLKVYSEGVKEFSISIFNRLGQEVYGTLNKDFAWNGYDTNGKPLPEGNYVYIIRIKDVIGKRHYKQGIVSIVR